MAISYVLLAFEKPLKFSAHYRVHLYMGKVEKKLLNLL